MSKIHHLKPLLKGGEELFPTIVTGKGRRKGEGARKVHAQSELHPQAQGPGKGLFKGVEKAIRPMLRPGTIPFSLGAVRDLVEEVMASVSDGLGELQEEMESGSREYLLNKLIVQRLMGGEFRDLDLSGGYPSAQPATVSAVSVSAFSLDLEIDYQGQVQWEGGAFMVEGHLELHLRQVAVSAASWTVNPDAGLTRLNATTLDTGRYLLHWENMTTFSIFDKQSRLSTTIWGDPHVDLSDMDGAANGEFSDLKKSDMVTVMDLLDGTRLVVKAPDTGVIQRVEVFKGDDYVEGIGLPERFFDEHGKLRGDLLKWLGQEKKAERIGGFFKEIEKGHEGHKYHPSVPFDYVKAGGDGNDWFDESGRLVWGG